MKYIAGMEFSDIVLGTDVYGSDMDTAQAYRMLDAYAAAGGNVLDTAHIYGRVDERELQRSEHTIGAWMKERGNRSRVHICTKGGHPNPDTMHISRLSRAEIESDMEDSLRALGTDHVELYYLHRDDETLPVGEIIETLSDLVKSGKTRAYGLSNWKAERVKEADRYAFAHGLPRPAASQIQFSLACANAKDIDPTLVMMDQAEGAYYAQSAVPVFAFASQAKGYFAKLALGGPDALSEKAAVRYDNTVSRMRFSRAAEIAYRMGKPVSRVALACLLQIPDFVVLPVIGCKTETQLADSLSATEIELDTATLAYIWHGQLTE